MPCGSLGTLLWDTGWNDVTTDIFRCTAAQNIWKDLIYSQIENQVVKILFGNTCMQANWEEKNLDYMDSGNW